MEEELPIFYNHHYILLDSSDNIVDGWSDGPLPNKDTSQAICINSEGGYQFRLFPDGEENPPLYNYDGLTLYKYEDDIVRAKTEAELKIDAALQLNKRLPSIKSDLINQSKQDLSIFLSTHPLTWTDGKTYSVTQEKQALLTEQLGLYTVDQDMPLYWNASGEECRVWPIASLASLAKAIANYVHPYVKYQQQKEKEIQLAETADEALAVKIDYSEVTSQ